jgi:alanyl-tRNA synthetase
MTKMKDIEKELAAVRSAQAFSQVGDLAKTAQVINGISFISSVMSDGVSGDDLRKIAIDLRSRDDKSVVALISANEGKPVLVVATSEGARSNGVKAGALVKIGSTVLGGGGGGKDDFAQGGGTDTSKSLDALTAISNSLIG